MKRLYLSLCLILSLTMALTGCAGSLSSCLRKGRLQSQEFEGTYDDAFKATLRVLQENGFIIKYSDYESGIIQGEAGAKRDWFEMMTNFDITATLGQPEENKVIVSLLLVKRIKQGIQYGTPKYAEIVDEPEFLQKIYEDIEKEISAKTSP